MVQRMEEEVENEEGGVQLERSVHLCGGMCVIQHWFQMEMGGSPESF